MRTKIQDSRAAERRYKTAESFFFVQQRLFRIQFMC